LINEYNASGCRSSETRQIANPVNDSREKFHERSSCGATPANIESRFQKTGIILYNSFLPLESQSVVDPPDFEILETIRIRTEVNEKILTFAQCLDFLCQEEYGRDMVEADYDINLPQISILSKAAMLKKGERYCHFHRCPFAWMPRELSMLKYTKQTIDQAHLIHKNVRN
jgi:hypothetical protein